MSGWLVNDKLTCIPGTKTFWHDLLSWIPSLVNKAESIDFQHLPQKIENDYHLSHLKPSYIIRNATFFRKLNIPIKTISLLQDSYINDKSEVISSLFYDQVNVCNSSDITVFNSPFTYNLYKNHIKSPFEIIPLGTNFEFFRKLDNKQELRSKYGFKNEPYVIFIGSNTIHPKGFDLLTEIIDKTNLNFCLVMKHPYTSNNPRVKVFNNINHDTLLEVINCCDVCVCTSKVETLHLSGVECGACGLPVVATNVGIYHNDHNPAWGHICSSSEQFINSINYVLNNYDRYIPREHFLSKKLDVNQCMESWKLITKEK